MFSINSRRKFDHDLHVFYKELNGLRGGHYKELAEKLRQNEIPLINAYSFAAMVENEREQLPWKIHEALYESAPQLLLQFVIAAIRVLNGEWMGWSTLIVIQASLVFFCLTLHLNHYVFHYHGLLNNFDLLHRSLDFGAHLLFVGIRIIALSFLMASYPEWFPVAAFSYLGFRFFYLYNCGSDRRRYREIMTHTYNTLWMLYRIFIPPINMVIWRMETYDDLIFHLETFAMTVSWPFLLDDSYLSAFRRWFPTGLMLMGYIISWPLLLYLISNFLGYDPFPLRKILWKDLKAVKIRVESSFGKSSSTSTSSYTYRIECPFVGIPPVVGTM
ncbi:uncharacterized protein LOC124173244 [Ischnura elegans]|uniref:uncharacterized protein LOC124173244 n=1 Tax=Ischnura elegans TaxID=197161 RepID=UPI001ED86955|nr:uncharacterized protein LOC124173244 [Ischnura elegans]